MANATATYGSMMHRVATLVGQLDKTDDIDEVIRLYDEAVSCLNACEERLERARGKFAEINAGAGVASDTGASAVAT